MAKRGVLEHPKTIELAAALDIPELYALGVLEGFWQWVARYHPRGDVTGTNPRVLARSIRYPADPAVFWQAMLDCGFIEVRGDGSTIVHDWSEHADNSVQQLLKKRGEVFADGHEPFTRNRGRVVNGSQSDDVGSQTIHKPFVNSHARVPEPEPIPEPEPVARAMPEPESTTPDGVAYSCARTREDEPPPKAKRQSPALEEWQWAEFQSTYPERNGDLKLATARDKLKALLKQGVDWREIIGGARRYRAWADATQNTGTPYVKQMPSWINGRGWEEPWAIPRGRAPNGRAAPEPQSLKAQQRQLMTDMGFHDEDRDTGPGLGGGDEQSPFADGSRVGEPEASYARTDFGVGARAQVGGYYARRG
jgi:hypothetical protein